MLWISLSCSFAFLSVCLALKCYVLATWTRSSIAAEASRLSGGERARRVATEEVNDLLRDELAACEDYDDLKSELEVLWLRVERLREERDSSDDTVEHLQKQIGEVIVQREDYADDLEAENQRKLSAQKTARELEEKLSVQEKANEHLAELVAKGKKKELTRPNWFPLVGTEPPPYSFSYGPAFNQMGPLVDLQMDRSPENVHQIMSEIKNWGQPTAPIAREWDDLVVDLGSCSCCNQKLCLFEYGDIDDWEAQDELTFGSIDSEEV